MPAVSREHPGKSHFSMILEPRGSVGGWASDAWQGQQE